MPGPVASSTEAPLSSGDFYASRTGSLHIRPLTDGSEDLSLHMKKSISAVQSAVRCNRCLLAAELAGDGVGGEVDRRRAAVRAGARRLRCLELAQQLALLVGAHRHAGAHSGMAKLAFTS